MQDSNGLQPALIWTEEDAGDRGNDKEMQDLQKEEHLAKFGRNSEERAQRRKESSKAWKFSES